MDDWATQAAWHQWMMDDWTTQAAWHQWMHASILAQMGWPLPQEYAYEAEDADYVEQEGFQFREIDITGELSRVSSEGLTEVEKATLAADCLRLQLATAKQTLEYVSDTMQFFQHPGGDDLELRAARALQDVDELLRQQAAQEAPPLPAVAVEHLKLVQRHACDVAVLACSRFISQTNLAAQGLPAGAVESPRGGFRAGRPSTGLALVKNREQ